MRIRYFIPRNTNVNLGKMMDDITSAFGNICLRRKFGPKRDANGECKRLHNEKLHSLYHSPNISRVIKSNR